MIKQFVQDIKWKYLFISMLLSLLILLIIGSITASIKNDTFILLYNQGHFQTSEIEQIESTGNAFTHSYIWLPLYLIKIIVVQAVSSWYLMKNSKGVELTNGIALGFLNSLVFYQLDPLNSGLAILVSLAIADKMKIKRQAIIIKISSGMRDEE